MFTLNVVEQIGLDSTKLFADVGLLFGRCVLEEKDRKLNDDIKLHFNGQQSINLRSQNRLLSSDRLGR